MTTESEMNEQPETAEQPESAEAQVEAPETASTDEPTAVDEPMATADEPTAAADEPVVTTDEPTADTPTTAADEPVAAAAETTDTDEPDQAAAEPAATANEPAAAADEPAASDEEPAAAPKAPAKAASKAKAPKAAASDRKAAASAEPESRAEAPAAPAEEPVARRKPVLEGPRPLRERYQSDVIPALLKQFEYGNPNQVPKLEKIVVNIGLGEALSNAKAIDAASSDLTMITGQKPIVTRARRSIAQFKIRAGNPIGLKVTLRGPRMWDFLERLLLLTLPRIRDFRGTPSRSFDGRGNYSLGMREQIAFPEIDYDKVDRLRGLEVSIVTTAKSDEESKRLLELLGMPFAG
jgi:large subunit ribosomal protein L5